MSSVHLLVVRLDQLLVNHSRDLDLVLALRKDPHLVDLPQLLADDHNQVTFVTSYVRPLGHHGRFCNLQLSI